MGGNVRGFTLIELVVTIAMLVILSSLAVPAYRHFMASNRAATEVNSFLINLQTARMAAMKHGTDVTMCVSDDGATCKGDGDWDEGWIIFTDSNDNRTVDADETLIQAHDPLPGSDELNGNGRIEKAITFNRFGIPAGVYAGTVVAHPDPDRIAYRRCVKVSRVGKMHVERGSDCCKGVNNCP